MNAQLSLEKVNTPAAWYGAELQRQPETWTYVLNDAEIGELFDASRKFKDSGIPIGKISPESFRLSKLSPFLDALADTLKHGMGFQLISGLPIDDCTPLDRAQIFCGIGSYIGKARSQNAAGHLLGHVRDTGADIKDPKVRIYQTTERQTFHTDSSDVVGLLCINEAKEGGDSMLASSMTAYNELLDRRPDLLAVLFDPIATDRRGEVPEGEKPYFTIPVYNRFEGFLTCIYQRNYIDSAKRFEDAPKLSDEQIEALDLLDTIVNEPEVNLRMRLKPGDMQFVYNHTMLHEQAIYQHDGRQYQVEKLDFDNRKAFVRSVKPDYYTTAETHTNLSVTQTDESTSVRFSENIEGSWSLGEVCVVDKVVGFKKIRFQTHENVGFGEVINDRLKRASKYK